MSAKLMTVIVTDMQCRGKGVESDPSRRITQYWSMQGELLAEDDPCEATEIRREKTCMWSCVGGAVYASPHQCGKARTMDEIHTHPYCETCGNKVEVMI